MKAHKAEGCIPSLFPEYLPVVAEMLRGAGHSRRRNNMDVTCFLFY